MQFDLVSAMGRMKKSCARKSAENANRIKNWHWNRQFISPELCDFPALKGHRTSRKLALAAYRLRGEDGDEFKGED
jgi:hypothetical protein